MEMILASIQMAGTRRNPGELRPLIRASQNSKVAPGIEDPEHAALSIMKNICHAMRSWVLSSSHREDWNVVRRASHHILISIGVSIAPADEVVV